MKSSKVLDLLKSFLSWEISCTTNTVKFRRSQTHLCGPLRKLTFFRLSDLKKGESCLSVDFSFKIN